MIATKLPRGEMNAISATDLAEILNVGTRELRKMIQTEREEGALILSSSAGYYRPGSREEISKFIDFMTARAKSSFRSIRAARKEMAKIAGQLDMESLQEAPGTRMERIEKMIQEQSDRMRGIDREAEEETDIPFEQMDIMDYLKATGCAHR